MQILTLVAMEKPASLDAEDIRDEKVMFSMLSCHLFIVCNISVLKHLSTVTGNYIGVVGDSFDSNCFISFDSFNLIQNDW